MPETLTDFKWLEHGRALGHEIEEVNDSDSKEVPVLQRSDGGGGSEEEGRGGRGGRGGRRKRRGGAS